MNFARPTFVYLLTLVPLVALFLIWATRRKRADVARLGTPTLIAALSSSVSVTRRRWKVALWFMALIALVLALARPRWGTRVQVTVQRGVQVMVALDVSYSMLAEDVKPDRLTRARLTVEELMERLGGNEVGLVLFAGAAFVQFPLTADFNTARSFLDAAGPWTISRPGTALEEALQVALQGFPAEIAGQRVILLLTDGEGHEGDPLAAADAAAEAGVTIYAIGFGSPAGEPIPMRDPSGALTGYRKDARGETVLSRLDETTLRQITSRTGGLYFRASAGGEEIAAITDAIAALDRGELESQFETQGVERFQWFAALALLALTAEFLLGERVTSRVLHVTFYFLLFTACAPDVVRHNNAGNARFAEGAYDEASIEYRQAQVNEPDWPQPYYNAANAYNRQGQIDATLAQAQQALKTADPDLAAKTWYNLGNAYFDVQQWPDAISAYQEALRINPDDLDAKYNLELAQQQQEQSQENQESESSEQAESGAATPTPSSTAEAAADEEQTTPEADSQATAGMTPEQALQLLQALIGESETLQERLQESYRVPRPPSEKDW